MQQTKSPIYNLRVNSSLPSTPDDLLEIIECSLLNIFKKKKDCYKQKYSKPSRQRIFLEFPLEQAFPSVDKFCPWLLNRPHDTFALFHYHLIGSGDLLSVHLSQILYTWLSKIE